MHRFFIDPNQIQARQVILTGEQARQICVVLRMGSGDRVLVLDNLGQQYEVEIVTAVSHQVTAKIIHQAPATGEPSVRLTLYQSLLKRQKFEWVLQKCTEVGVTQIVPIVTRRSLARNSVLKDNKLVRWQKIITEAAEQAGRGRIPNLEPAMTFQKALADSCSHDFALLAWENEALPLRQAIQASSGPSPTSVGLFIGPEGGFDPSEIAQAESKSVATFSLGSRILRTETAAIVASALILHELELE